MFSKIDINRIAEAVDIVDLVGAEVKLKPQGKTLVGCCPFHTEKTGSFAVSQARQTYHCFGCGKHGDVFQWVMEREGCNYPEAVRRLARRANIEINEREKTAEEIARETKREAMLMITQQVNAWFVAQLEANQPAKDYALKRWGVKGKRKDGTQANPMDYIRETGIGFAPPGNALLDWAKQQGISLDMLKELNIVGTKDGHDYSFFRNRITIPIRSRTNQIEGWTCRDLSGQSPAKYLNSTDSELYHKKTSLFGLDVAKPEIRATGKVYVAEGAPDVMRMQIIGVPNTVAPLGTGTMGDDQFDLLQSCFPKSGKRTLCLLPDADVTKEDGTNPGEATAIKIGCEALRRGYSVLIKAIPNDDLDSKQDPDTYFTTPHRFKEVKEDDFIIWYAHKLLDRAENIDTATSYIETIAAMVASIGDETAIEGYLKKLKDVYNNPTLWRKAVTKAGKAQKQKEVEEKAFSKEGFTKYGFYESGGGYWALSGQTELRWSNFTMRPLFHIKDAINPKRLYELRNEAGSREIVELKQEDLVSLSKFRQRVEGLGNYIFEANEQCLIKLKRYLYEQTQTAVEITQLGWQKQGFYAFGNGVQYQGNFIKTDDYGIVSLPDGQNYYLPGASKIYKDDQLFQFEKRFWHHGYSSIPLRQVAEAMIKVFGDNAKVGLCFLVATLFRDVITSTVKAFPMLNLFGPKGSGKSELGHTLMSFFIIQNIPPNLSNSTIAALSEAVAQCADAIVHLDEFKNNIDLDKREFLKGLWDSAGRTRMNMDRDKKREQTKVDSGVIISGQEMATADIALFSRFVYLTFNKTEFTTAERNAFADLDRMRKLGFSHLTLEILNQRETFKQNFAAMYAATASEVMDAIGDTTCESRIVNNWVTIAAAYRTIETLIDLPFTYADIFKIITEGIRRQNAMTTTSNEIGMFWRQIGRTQMEGKFSINADYRIEYRADLKTNKMPNGTYFATTRPILFLNPDAWYQAYTYKAKENGIVPLPDSSIIYYLENSPEYLGKYGVMRFSNKLPNGQLAAGTTSKRPLCFDYSALSNKYGLSIEVELEDLDPKTNKEEELPY